jgi:hypothetical protein
MSLTRTLLIFGCGLMLVGMQAWADPTFTIDAGTLTASRFIPLGAPETDDVRGLVEITVSGDANPVIITDSQNGTDPTFAAPLPFGNSSLTGFVVAGPQADTIAFNFASSIFSPTTDTITAVGTPIFPVPNTDPALLAFDQPLLYTFTLFNFVNPVPGTTAALAQYSLTSISVATPEPALAGVVALGLMMLFGYMRLRRRIAA